MTAGALGEERPTLFLRNATGLVRGWSVRDSMIYASPVHQRGDAGHGGVDRAVVLPAREPAVLDPPLRGVGLVPGRGLRRTGGDHPRARRRLRLAEPHPGQRDRLRDGRHRMVVHLVAVGADLRGRAGRAVLPADLGHARLPRHVLRQRHREVRRHADHDRAGRAAGLDRHGGLRPGPEVVLLRRPARCPGPGHPAAGVQPQPASSPRSTSRRTSCSASTAPTSRSTCRRPRPATSRRRSAAARSARACCWCRS